MNNKDLPLHGFLATGALRLMLEAHEITVQPPPTSERIKGLLSRGLMEPETLTPEEIQELSASVVYFLISARRDEEPPLV